MTRKKIRNKLKDNYIYKRTANRTAKANLSNIFYRGGIRL